MYTLQGLKNSHRVDTLNSLVGDYQEFVVEQMSLELYRGTYEEILEDYDKWSDEDNETFHNFINERGKLVEILISSNPNNLTLKEILENPDMNSQGMKLDFENDNFLVFGELLSYTEDPGGWVTFKDKNSWIELCRQYREIDIHTETYDLIPVVQSKPEIKSTLL